MIRLSDLDGKMIVTTAGERLGRVHDVRADRGQVVALECGARSWRERLAGHGEARHIAWPAVREVRGDAILVEIDKR